MAKILLGIALRLAAQFQEWIKKRPPDIVRIAGIRELFELNRQVLDHYAGASGERRRTSSDPPSGAER
jgi:hypothetical protein